MSSSAWTLGNCFFSSDDGLGVADAGHHVLALRVDEEVAVGALGARGGVAREPDAGPRVVVAVAEDHRLHVDGGAEIVRDVLALAVRDGTGTVPAAEHGLDGAAQLLHRLLGEGLAGVALHDLLVGVDQVAQQLDGDLGVRRRPGELLGRLEERVELLTGQLEDDAPVHGDEAPVGVEGEALVAGLLGQPLDRFVVEAQVEDRVHHAGHGELGARAHRDEQRVGGVADGLAHGLLEPGPGGGHLRVEALGPAARHVVAAGVGRDGEPRGHGELEYRRHLGQVGALAAQEVLELHRRTGVRVVEIEDVRHRASLPWTGEPRGGARSLGGHTPLPIWDGVGPAYFPPDDHSVAVGQRCGAPPGSSGSAGGSRPVEPETWRWKTSLAWRM